MSIPIHTTLITATRQIEAEDIDPYDEDAVSSTTTVATSIRARITSPSASNALSGGDRIVYTAQLYCDPCALLVDDTITETDGTQWRLLWVKEQQGLGLDHMIGQLRLVQGAV